MYFSYFYASYYSKASSHISITLCTHLHTHIPLTAHANDLIPPTIMYQYSSCVCSLKKNIGGVPIVAQQML